MSVLDSRITVPVKLEPALYRTLRAIADRKGCQVHHLLEQLAERATQPKRTPSSTHQPRPGDPGVTIPDGYRHKPVPDGDPLFDDLEDLHRHGCTDAQISARLGLTLDHARRLRRRLGLKPNSPYQHRRQQITELHGEGLNDQEIADKLGITPQSVCDTRRTLGLPSNYDRKVTRR
ncbi:helix-turn-helix domain-containing protein [Pseudoclavibacter sp. CFCC 11306]|uniref:helix-turn-helix domain-containing protein n=1 Tax=Pseudoclavibacter sp. CFCC 11306 TaxID=1564493 RepID=UPI0013015A0D|nr:helix-turn-helix domain-containing protein [Pseudoclavibacter sp. CFCC 11306]KAB1658996.1 helix-turn-helix domain-containing protein [Pseudoclavibacter sp. CFCC 11306]